MKNEIIREVVLKYIKEKPALIRLKVDLNSQTSEITLKGQNLDKKFEYSESIDFNSFAHGVIEAYKEIYGDLEAIPISFREEIYENDKVRLDLYPTGSVGIFDIFVEYKDS